MLCDWLPWNHTFGGNHNFGIVLDNGGTLYIDDGKPLPGAFDTTVRNLREVPVTAYFNVPKGYELLVPRLQQDERLREHFFARLKMLFCAAAALRQHVADDMLAMAAGQGGRRIPLVTGLGSTETAPFALCAGDFGLQRRPHRRAGARRRAEARAGGQALTRRASADPTSRPAIGGRPS